MSCPLLLVIVVKDDRWRSLVVARFHRRIAVDPPYRRCGWASLVMRRSPICGAAAPIGSRSRVAARCRIAIVLSDTLGKACESCACDIGPMLIPLLPATTDCIQFSPIRSHTAFPSIPIVSYMHNHHAEMFSIDMIGTTRTSLDRCPWPRPVEEYLQKASISHERDIPGPPAS